MFSRDYKVEILGHDSVIENRTHNRTEPTTGLTVNGLR